MAFILSLFIPAQAANAALMTAIAVFGRDSGL